MTRILGRPQGYAASVPLKLVIREDIPYRSEGVGISPGYYEATWDGTKWVSGGAELNVLMPRFNQPDAMSFGVAHVFISRTDTGQIVARHDYSAGEWVETAAGELDLQKPAAGRRWLYTQGMAELMQATDTARGEALAKANAVTDATLDLQAEKVTLATVIDQQVGRVDVGLADIAQKGDALRVQVDAALNAISTEGTPAQLEALAALNRTAYLDGAMRAADGTLVTLGAEYPKAAFTGRNALADTLDGAVYLITRTTQALKADGQAAAAGVLPGSEDIWRSPPVKYVRDIIGFIPMHIDPDGNVWGSNAGSTLMVLRPGAAQPEAVKVFAQGVKNVWSTPLGALMVSTINDDFAPASTCISRIWRRSTAPGSDFMLVDSPPIGGVARWGAAHNGSRMVLVGYGVKSPTENAVWVKYSDDDGLTWTTDSNPFGPPRDWLHGHALTWDRYSGLWWYSTGDISGPATRFTNARVYSSPSALPGSWTVRAEGYQPIWLVATSEAVYGAQDSGPEGIIRLNKASNVVSLPLNLHNRGKAAPYDTQAATLLQAGEYGPWFYATYAQPANAGKQATIWVAEKPDGPWVLAEKLGESRPAYNGTGIYHAIYNPRDGLIYAWATWLDSAGVDRIGTRVIKAPRPYKTSGIRTGRSKTNLASANQLDPTDTTGFEVFGAGAAMTWDGIEKWRTPGNGSVKFALPGTASNGSEGGRAVVTATTAGTLGGGLYLWASVAGAYYLQIRDLSVPATAENGWGIKSAREITLSRQPTFFAFPPAAIAAAGRVEINVGSRNSVPTSLYMAGVTAVTGGTPFAGRPEISGVRNGDIVRKNHVQSLSQGTLILELDPHFDSDDDFAGQPISLANLSGSGEQVRLSLTATKVLQFQAGITGAVYVVSGTLSFSRRDPIRIIARWKAGALPSLSYVIAGKRVDVTGTVVAPANAVNSVYMNIGEDGQQNRAWEGVSKVVVLPAALTDAQVNGELARTQERQLP